ncbi:MAG: hypothetical protein ACRC4L_04115 [Mycoplasma sp.]
MEKIHEKKKNSIIAGAKFNNTMGFAYGMGFNLVSNLISNVTSTVAQDIYNKNPNPADYKANMFNWNGMNMRFTPNAGKSSYSIIGGW